MQTGEVAGTQQLELELPLPDERHFLAGDMVLVRHASKPITHVYDVLEYDPKHGLVMIGHVDGTIKIGSMHGTVVPTADIVGHYRQVEGSDDGTDARSEG